MFLPHSPFQKSVENSTIRFCSSHFWKFLCFINMSFRRLPFQFSATDPAEKQRELERRFGLPSSNMYVDVSNPLSAGAAMRETNSPRLQHRVPIFVEGHDKPIQSSVDAMGSACDNKKPNVRVIPIEIEVAERPSSRHRTFSGPPGLPKENSSSSETASASPFKRSMEDLSQPSKVKHTAGPRVFNIPIQVEGAGTLRADKKKKESPKVNGCTVTKSQVKSPVQEQKVKPEKEQKKDSADPVENALKKIQDVLAEFRIHEKGIQDFCGTTKDKQYRYLDEMLTRCMLKLDELDTMGNENIRCSRKGAVKQIQASIDLLESKANGAVTTDTEMKQVTSEVANEQQGELVEKSKLSNVEMKDVAPESQENSRSADETKSPEMYNEVEMKEKESEVNVTSTPSDEDAKYLEAMPGTAEVLNQVIDKVEENDVEMQNSIKEKHEVTIDSTELEVSSAVPIDKVEVMGDKPVEELPKEKSNEVPEVEMGEVSTSEVSSAGETRMTEDGELDAEEIKLDAKDEDASQDVEMKDVQDGEVNSTVLDNQCNSIESAGQCSDEPKEQCTTDTSQSVKDVFSAGTLAELAADVAENCVQASTVTDSSNSIDSSQN